jgi:peptidyl-prolyl cis-trans isomerase A (cyclophilin A)
MKWFTLTSAAIFLCSAAAKAQIYADFSTSMGNFTCELNYTAAPKTVANFISLAEGTRKWVTPAGTIQENKPFYNGLIFHRVIAGFMNQGGCPLGTGTSGPGYVFPDETTNGLRHEGNVISMANSGTNTNGSQFFITVGAPKTHLDGVHTVFGEVTSGTSVVEQMNVVPTTSDRPDTPVVIQSVTIRRVGAAAEAFDIQAQQLPIVRELLPGNLQVDLLSKVDFIPRRPRISASITDVYRSENLATWAIHRRYFHAFGVPDSSPFEIDTKATNAASLAAKGFYRVVETEYPDALAPRSLAGRTFIATWDNGAENMTFTINSTGTQGDVIYSAGNTSFPEFDYSPDVYNPAPLTFHTNDYGSLGFDCIFTDQTATHITGKQDIYQYRQSGWVRLGSGTFTLTK